MEFVSFQSVALLLAVQGVKHGYNEKKKKHLMWQGPKGPKGDMGIPGVQGPPGLKVSAIECEMSENSLCTPAD